MSSNRDLDWAVKEATALSTMWEHVAPHISYIDMWQLMSVCKAARAGVKKHLGSLPSGLVVSGGVGDGLMSCKVWQLNLASLCWEEMPSLAIARSSHASCVVRDRLVVLGGIRSGGDPLSSVERLTATPYEMPAAYGAGIRFFILPPLSSGGLYGAVAIPVEESASLMGQILLLGGVNTDLASSPTQMVDVATGQCLPLGQRSNRFWTPLSQLSNLFLSQQPLSFSSAKRLPDGRIVAAGGVSQAGYAEIWGPPPLLLLPPQPPQIPARSQQGGAGESGTSHHQDVMVTTPASTSTSGQVAPSSSSLRSSSERIASDQSTWCWSALPTMHDWQGRLLQ